MNSILITGCNRGLGLGMVKALVKLAKPPQHLFATCRNKDQAKELQELAFQNPNIIHILEIDLCDFNAYDKLVTEIDNITQGKGLNVLFNNAGVASNLHKIDDVNAEDLIKTFQTNTVVPIMLAKACLPLLKKASKEHETLDFSVQRAAIINMSSALGSIKCNNGGYFVYRSSKAALNSATKSLSNDLYPYKILCVAFHPGWVRTDMGGAEAPLEVESTTAEIIDTIFKLNAIHNGGFYQYDGKMLPW